MEIDDFWNYVARARADAGDDASQIAGRVMELLVQQSVDTIEDFDRTLYRVLAQAHTRGLWAAAAIINYGGSDEGFAHFRAWLVTQGEETFGNAVEDPDVLADIIDVDGTAECEEMLYVAQYAFERRTGHEIQSSRRMYPHKDVAVLAEGELAVICPRLWAKFSA